jgi:trehalose synthase
MSDVIVQKSIREGFGLVVSESLWKSTPVVAGRAGGIPLQMSDGVGGFLVDGVEECAHAIVRLLQDATLARELGARGHDRVREHFLLPRLLLNELTLVSDLLKGTLPITKRQDGLRDPVCGMALTDAASAVRIKYGGFEFLFCSEACKMRFLSGPERYLAARLNE